MTDSAAKKPVYKRVLLKLSGEALQGQKGHGIDPKTCRRIADEIKEIWELGVEVAIVVGGGNIFRGIQASADGFNRVSADYMGMLATILNGVALQDSLGRSGVPAHVQTAIEIQELAEPFILRRSLEHLEQNNILIFVGGIGQPYFSTDTTAALRAIEIGADVILKATKVDGVFSDDPVKNSEARKFDNLTYIEVIQKKLAVMDMTAITLGMDNHVPIVVFNLTRPGNIKKIIFEEKIGTTIREV